jgi:hypothetical protein
MAHTVSVHSLNENHHCQDLACEDLLHTSTSPQVETVRTCELAKCRGDEGGCRCCQRAARSSRPVMEV